MAILLLMRASSMPNVFLRGAVASLVVIVSALPAEVLLLRESSHSLCIKHFIIHHSWVLGFWGFGVLW